MTTKPRLSPQPVLGQANRLLLAALLSAASLRAQSSDAQPNPREAARTNAAAADKSSEDPIALIREEALNRSQVMDTVRYLTDAIGPRLTGSPNLKRANEWTREKLISYGLTKAHLEAWGPFGRGWSLRRFSAQITEPQTIPLIGYPRAWSPGFDQTLVANVVHLDATNAAGLERYAGKLKGAIVLLSTPRELKARFEPLASRLNETNLLRLANAPEPGAQPARRPNFGGAFGDEPPADSPTPARRRGPPGSSSTDGPASASGPTNRPSRFGGRFGQSMTNLNFCAKEGAALLVSQSSQGDGGTFFVAAATVPGAPEFGGSSPTNQSDRAALRSPRDTEDELPRRRNRPGGPTSDRKLIRQRDYEKLSAYFNLDNGTGKIRGVHLQGNEAVRPLFRKWLNPFTELGAETLTLSNTGGTDHTSFDAIGLPGFQFIQDPLDYDTRTHHSNMDVYDRVQADDLKQASVVTAAFVYQTAMLDDKLPRKPLAD